MAFDSYLVSPKQLSDALGTGGATSVIPVCASWFLPNDPKKRTGSQVYEESHIPNARFLDIDVVKGDSPYPHMLPTPEDFASAMGSLGISPQDTVVVYDSKELGIFSAPRVAWMLNAFGHSKVHVLNNFKLWIEQSLPVESGAPAKVNPADYPVPKLKAVVVDFEEMQSIVGGSCKAYQVLDARPGGRWEGKDPEPRPGLPSGHMQGSTSVPFNAVLDPETKAYLPKPELRKLFESKGVNSATPIISSCGTGVTAAVIDLALAEAFDGKLKQKIYDGSWTEWAQRVPEQKPWIVSS